MVVTIAMFIGFARSRPSTEIVSLMTIAVIAVFLYFFPLPDTRPTDGLSLAFSGFGHYALITICALMIMGRGLVVTGALDAAGDGVAGYFAGVKRDEFFAYHSAVSPWEIDNYLTAF